MDAASTFEEDFLGAGSVNFVGEETLVPFCDLALL
jgi:hypothetical protein